MDVRHAEPGAQVGVVGMVGDDDAHVAGQLAGRPAHEQVGEAVRLARGEERGRDRAVREANVGRHPEALGDRRERRGDVVAGHAEPVELELDALEEHRAVADDVEVLVGVEDVAAVARR